jgi:hypothetical protein
MTILSVFLSSGLFHMYYPYYPAFMDDTILLLSITEEWNFENHAWEGKKLFGFCSVISA